MNFAKNGGNVNAKYSFAFAAHTRNQLFDSNYDPESLTKQTDEDLHHMQEQTFAGFLFNCNWCIAQEQALEDISDTLGRLHEIGSAIGQEVDIQTVFFNLNFQFRNCWMTLIAMWVLPKTVWIRRVSECNKYRRRQECASGIL